MPSVFANGATTEVLSSESILVTLQASSQPRPGPHQSPEEDVRGGQALGEHALALLFMQAGRRGPTEGPCCDNKSKAASAKPDFLTQGRHPSCPP